MRVPKAHLNDPAVQRALRGFRRSVLVSGVIAILITLAAWNQPIIASFTSIIVVIGGLYGYLRQRRGIIEAKQQCQWFNEVETIIAGRVAQSRFPRKLAELITPRFPWIWMLGSLSALAAAVALLITHWSEIPQTIPTHWRGNIEVDSWSEKSVSSVFMGTWVGLGVLVMFAGVAATVQWAHVHNRSDRSVKGSIRTAAGLAATNTALGALSFMMCLPISFLQTVSVIPRYQHLIPVAFYGFMICAALGTVVLITIVYGTISRVDGMLRGIEFSDGSGSESDKESPDNDEFYKWGMFYYNPDDPAVLVERRFGVGMSFNYAHWQAKVFLAIIALTLVACVALPFIL